MAYKEGVLDPVRRARDIHESRDSDKRLMASGAVSRSDLAKANGFFSALPVHEFKIVSIGQTPRRRIESSLDLEPGEHLSAAEVATILEYVVRASALPWMRQQA